jgi:hypothetical protein
MLLQLCEVCSIDCNATFSMILVSTQSSETRSEASINLPIGAGEGAIDTLSIGSFGPIGAYLARQTAPSVAAVYRISSTHAKDTQSNSRRIANNLRLRKCHSRQDGSE